MLVKLKCICCLPLKITKIDDTMATIMITMYHQLTHEFLGQLVQAFPKEEMNRSVDGFAPLLSMVLLTTGTQNELMLFFQVIKAA